MASFTLSPIDDFRLSKRLIGWIRTLKYLRTQRNNSRLHSCRVHYVRLIVFPTIKPLWIRCRRRDTWPGVFQGGVLYNSGVFAFAVIRVGAEEGFAEKAEAVFCSLDEWIR